MREISMDTFYDKVKSGKDMNVLDVRPLDMYEKGHVPGVQHLPLKEMENRLEEIDKNKHYYLICQKGKTSVKAYELLDGLGYDVTNIEGGTSQYPGELDQ